MLCLVRNKHWTGLGTKRHELTSWWPEAARRLSAWQSQHGGAWLPGDRRNLGSPCMTCIDDRPMPKRMSLMSIDEGDAISAEEERATYVGVLRHHIANMLAPLNVPMAWAKPRPTAWIASEALVSTPSVALASDSTRLACRSPSYKTFMKLRRSCLWKHFPDGVSCGYTDLANSIRQLANQSDARGYKQSVQQAHQFLEMVLLETSLRTGDYPLIDDWLGRIVTRSGPLPSERVPRAVRRTLASLDLRPVFVGLERRLVHAAIDGDPASIVRTLGDGSTTSRKGRTDRAGSWIIPLDDGAQEDL